MEAIQRRVSVPLRRMLATRSGTLTLAAAVAALAAILLVAFLGRYGDSIRGGATTQTALVAGALIPKGTSGDVVIGEQMFKPTAISTDQLVDDAVLDTAAIAGKVATQDIYPGQQISADAFASKADGIRGRLTGAERAISVPVEGAQGMVGKLRAGDRVDVLASFASTGRGTRDDPMLRTLLQNALVLSVPAEAEEGDEADITLRASDKQAAALAFAVEHGKVWFALRPPAGATDSEAATVDLQSIVAGSVPTKVEEDR